MVVACHPGTTRMDLNLTPRSDEGSQKLAFPIRKLIERFKLSFKLLNHSFDILDFSHQIRF